VADIVPSGVKLRFHAETRRRQDACTGMQKGKRLVSRHGTHDAAPDGAPEFLFAQPLLQRCRPVRGLRKGQRERRRVPVAHISYRPPNLRPMQQHCRLDRAATVRSPGRGDIFVATATPPPVSSPVRGGIGSPFFTTSSRVTISPGLPHRSVTLLIKPGSS
jgi:hypothetical protein